jgi:gamma-glutamyl phosphate reductase
MQTIIIDRASAPTIWDRMCALFAELRIRLRADAERMELQAARANLQRAEDEVDAAWARLIRAKGGEP